MKSAYTGYTQKNGAVSEVNKKFISHLTHAQLTPPAVTTVQLPHALPAVRFSCLLRGQFPRWRRSRKRHHAPCTKLTSRCNHRSGHLKTEHIESLFLLRRRLGNWSLSKHQKRTAVSAWETWTVAAADGVRCARVRWEINFLLTFETAPFFCVYPAYVYLFLNYTVLFWSFSFQHFVFGQDVQTWSFSKKHFFLSKLCN